MKAIVGLGNPGGKYKFTRHNVGFLLIDEIARSKRVKLSKEGFFSSFGRIKVERKIVFLFKPLTYMNLSGKAVAGLKKGLKIKLEDLLIVCDDANLDKGNIRFRSGGSSGGHNGLNSIIEALRTTDFPRLRIGIGNHVEDEKSRSLEDYVLKPLDEEEVSFILPVVSRAAEAALYWAECGIYAAMNKFNIRQKDKKS